MIRNHFVFFNVIITLSPIETEIENANKNGNKKRQRTQLKQDTYKISRSTTKTKISFHQQRSRVQEDDRFV